MKIKSALYLVLFILYVTLISPAVSANNEILDWPASVETKKITVIQDGDPIYYRFVPTETREYAIKYPGNVPLGYEFRSSNDDVLEFWNWIDDENNFHDIYTLTAGTEYILTLFYGGVPTPEGKYTGKVSILPWENKLTLPDYPYLQDNQKVSFTVTNDLCEYYLYSPAESGTFCVGRNTSCIRVNLSPVMKTHNDTPHDPEHLGDWRTDTMQGDLYHLEKDNIYLICIEGFAIVEGDTITDTVWIRPGEAPKNEYPVWDIKEAKTVSLKKDEIAKYYLTPAATGKYMVRTTEGIRIEVIDGPDMLGTEFITSDGVEGYVYDLEAGKQYTVILQEWGSFADSISGTFRFEKVGAVKSASIYVANFHSESYFLGIDFDPICGGLEGVTWSVSDPSVFSIVSQHDNGIELSILKQGKATVTAKVGKVTASIELTAPGKLPVLTEGKTLNLTIGGTAAEFTPDKSGKYQFTVTPNRAMLFSVYENVEEDPLYFKEEFSEKLTFTMNLDAGVTYELVQLFGRSSVSVKYAGGSSSQGSTAAPTTQPTPPAATTAPTTQPTTPSPTAPSQAVTEPTQNTDPISTDASAPSAPSETVPEDDTAGKLITQEDISAATQNATDQVIRFSTSELNEGFRLSADALQLAADKDCSIAFEFPGNIAVQLDNATLQALSGAADGKEISFRTTQQLYTALNESQQKALEGKSLICLLDIELSAGDSSIHQLGGTATVSFSNIDTSKDWSVLYLAEDGSVEVMGITSDGSISFCTDHFSHYALILNNGQTDAPNNRWILPVVIALVVIAGGGTAAFLIIRKMKK